MRIPANHQLNGGLENRYGPLGPSRVQIPPPPPPEPQFRVRTRDCGSPQVIGMQCFARVPQLAGLRVHQIRLQGGDASSDSYCYS